MLFINSFVRPLCACVLLSVFRDLFLVRALMGEPDSSIVEAMSLSI